MLPNAIILAGAVTMSPPERKADGNLVRRCTVPRRGEAALLVPHSVGELQFPKWGGFKPGDPVFVCRPTSYHMLALLNERGESYALIQKGARTYPTLLSARIGKSADEVVLESVYEPPRSGADAENPAMPFESEIVPFYGGWFAAARIYRERVENEPWVKAARARDFGKLRDIGMWFWNRGAGDNVIPPVERFQKDSGVPAALDWYWWHAISYDTGYPNFWPPREGEASFRKAVKRLNDGGIYCQTYVNGMTWDVDDPSWAEGGEECVRRREDGTYVATAWNRFTGHRLANMCGESRKYQAHMRRTVKKIVACGFDGQYLDMIGNAAYGTCFATNHVHARGGGDHMVVNFRRYVEDIRRDNPGLHLSTEDGNESYLELFESVILTAPSYERFSGGGEVKVKRVPVFPAVYHGAVVMFGNFAMIDGIPAWDPLWPDAERWKEEKEWEKLFPDQFQVEIARGVIWGAQPAAHNFKMNNATDARYADGYRFMIDTARFYHAHRDFLFDGEMLDPGELACAELKVEFLNRGTYTKAGEYRTATNVLPAVFHSVWRNPAGGIAAVLVNWSRAPQRFRLAAPDVSAEGELPPRSWRLVPKAGRVDRVRDYGAKGDGVTKDTTSIQRAIDACSESGGGEVLFEGGKFLTGMFFLRDNVTLRLAADGVILGSPDCADYPTNRPLRHLDAAKSPRLRTTALIVADECRNVGIVGTGAIDCNGDAFVEISKSRSYGYAENARKDETEEKPLGCDWVSWKYRRKPGLLSPPRMVLFAGCSDVKVEDVTLMRPAAGWGYWVTDCDRVAFNRAKVLADQDYPNNDGIHINASRDVSVANCRIVAGDDAIVVRCNCRALAENKACERVSVSNCQLSSYANCIRIGWLNDGVIRNCTFSNLSMTDSAAGIGIDLPRFEKGMSDYGREASRYENLTFDGIVMDGIYSSPVRFDVTDDSFTRMEAIRGITFSNMRCRSLKFPTFKGRTGKPFEDVVFKNCSFTKVPEGTFPGKWRQKGAAYWYNAGEEKFSGFEGVRFEGCTFNNR